MVPQVDVHGVLALLEEGGQLLEVLPPHEYDEEHLVDALSIPLNKLTEQTAAVLNKDLPVVAYCWDAICDMSPRAVHLLRSWGFDAHDYTVSKVDWIARGLPTVRAQAAPARVGDHVDNTVPFCGPTESAAAVLERSRASGWPICAVVDDDFTIIGRLRLGKDDLTGAVADVMDSGPRTVHPSDALDEVVERMTARGVPALLVSDPDGHLIGGFRP